MQAAVQQYVDGSISKTINLPATATFDDVRPVFDQAHALGLKGCTIFRADSRRHSVIVNLDTEIFDRKATTHACGGVRVPDVGAPPIMN